MYDILRVSTKQCQLTGAVPRWQLGLCSRLPQAFPSHQSCQSRRSGGQRMWTVSGVGWTQGRGAAWTPGRRPAPAQSGGVKYSTQLQQRLGGCQRGWDRNARRLQCSQPSRMSMSKTLLDSGRRVTAATNNYNTTGLIMELFPIYLSIIFIYHRRLLPTYTI